MEQLKEIAVSYEYVFQLQILPMQYTVPFWSLDDLGGAELSIVTLTKRECEVVLVGIRR